MPTWFLVPIAGLKLLTLDLVESTEYIIYCKRAILFLSSSKILTPHPPIRPASVYPLPLLGEGRTDSPGGEGDGGAIFWKTREIGLPSYSKICTLWLKEINANRFF